MGRRLAAQPSNRALRRKGERIIQRRQLEAAATTFNLTKRWVRNSGQSLKQAVRAQERRAQREAREGEHALLIAAAEGRIPKAPRRVRWAARARNWITTLRDRS